MYITFHWSRNQTLLLPQRWLVIENTSSAVEVEGSGYETSFSLWGLPSNVEAHPGLPCSSMTDYNVVDVQRAGSLGETLITSYVINSRVQFFFLGPLLT